MFNLGAPELVLVLAIGLLLFGNKLPGVARSLGQALLAFRREVSGLGDELPPR